MKYVASAALALSLVFAATAEAGAKGGKLRWSSNPHPGRGKPALQVPAAQGTRPGSIALKIVFKAGELAEFAAIGDGDTAIDVVVKDGAGRVVAEDVHPIRRASDLSICRWIPDKEQEYTIILYNHGKVYNLCQAGCN